MFSNHVKMFAAFVLVLFSYCTAQTFNQLDFSVEKFDDPNVAKTHFQLVNSEVDVNTASVRLTSFSRTGSGAVWYRSPVFVKGMKINFSMYISNSNQNPEGIVFLIQNSAEGTNALRTYSAGIGYATANDVGGIENSLAIEFDCQSNLEMNDPSSIHISIHSIKKASNSANENTAGLLKPPVLSVPLFMCNSVTDVEIIYEPGTTPTQGFLTVSLSSLASPSIDKFRVVLDDYVNLKDGSLAYIGFTASTGADNGANQEILSWKYEFLGEVTPSKCYASGSGLTNAVAGNDATFVVTTVDQYGNKYPVGGSTITLQFDGPTDAIIDYRVMDNVDGTYTATYSTTVSGSYRITIYVNSVLIGNPSSLTVSPASVDPLKTKAIETVPESTDVDKVNSFKIQTYDQYSNLVKVGGARVTATLDPNLSNDDVEVLDNRDGTYTIRFSVFKAVSYKLSVSTNDVPIIGGPFTFVALPGPLDQKSCTVEGLSPTITAGSTQIIRVTSFDEFGNPIPQGGASFEVYFSPTSVPRGAKIELVDFKNGAYEANVYAEQSGRYSLNILLSGKSVASSPYSITINPDVISIPNCVAEGTNLESGMAGVTSSFEITTKDKFNNEITTRATIQFSAMIIGSVNITATTENRFDGSVYVTYLPTVSGKYTTYVQAQGQLVQNTPASTSISTATVSSLDSYVIDSSYPFKISQAEKHTWLQVQSRDKYKNLIQIGGANVVANILSENPKRTPINATVVDNQNGTYTVVYTPLKDQIGDYTMSILMNGVHIQDSPFALDVSPVDKTNVILIAVGVPLIVLCVAGLVGLVAYKRYQKNKGYQLIQQTR